LLKAEPRAVVRVALSGGAARMNATPQSKPLAEEDLADSALINPGNDAALFKTGVTVPRLRFRFIGLRRTV
jgi:hypothetical protein